MHVKDSQLNVIVFFKIFIICKTRTEDIFFNLLKELQINCHSPKKTNCFSTIFQQKMKGKSNNKEQFENIEIESIPIILN